MIVEQDIKIKITIKILIKIPIQIMMGGLLNKTQTGGGVSPSAN